MKKIFIFFLVTLMSLPYFKVQANASQTPFLTTIVTTDARVYALMNNGDLYFWGKATYNEINGDQSLERAKPVKLMEDVIGVYGGWFGGYAIKSDHSLWVIGSGVDAEGNLKESTDPPVKMMDNVKEVACAYTEWIALKTDGTVWEWDYYKSRKPHQVIINVKQISAGIESFYAVRTDGSLWGWGQNYSGALGIKTSYSYMYKPIRIMLDVESVHGAGLNAFAIKTDGSLWGWGDNWNGIIYTGKEEEWSFAPYPDGSQSTVTSQFTPSKLMDDVIKITGRNNYAILKKDHSLWVWGNNEDGQLGNGTTISQKEPIKVLDDVVDVAANSGNTFILKKDGTLWGCGTNGRGELGLGSFDEEPHTTFIQIMDNIALPSNILHTPSLWAKEGIKSAIEFGIVPSQLQSCYSDNIKRGEFATLITSLITKITNEDLETLVSQSISPKDIYFNDTNDENILNLARLGIISGVGNNNYNEDGTLTREQAAKILRETAKFLGLNTGDQQATIADRDTISSWALDGVNFCYNNGIMTGTGDNKFGPRVAYSREMSIITIGRLYYLLINKPTL